MNTPLKKNKTASIDFSFLKEGSEAFFKKGIPLTSGFNGKPLDELISLNDLDGVLLDKKDIQLITEIIYRKFSRAMPENLSIKDSKINFFIYTSCKIDDILLLVVFEIFTEISSEGRNSWENFYKLIPGECCKKTYYLSIDANPNSDSSLQQDCLLIPDKSLQEVIEKNCKYKTPYIRCRPVVHCHFLNRENSKARQYFDNSWFNIVINDDSKFYPYADQIFFSYGGESRPALLTCTSLYDSIVFEKTSEKIFEKNFQKFISDSLHTCFSYSTVIINFKQIIKIRELRLLHASLYFRI